MMKAALWFVAAVVLGLIVAFVLVVAVELFSGVVHPVPEGFGGTVEEMNRHVENYPPWVLGVAVPAWAVTALVSTWIARRIGNLYASVIVGLLLLAALAFNLSHLPYPIWFKIANMVAIPVAIIAGSRMGRKSQGRGPLFEGKPA